MQQNEFVQLVAKMREAQKAYFRGRTSMDLQRSKKLEREVDAELSHYTFANGQAVAQPSLFDEQPAQRPAKPFQPVLGLRCRNCKAVFQLVSLAHPIDEDIAQEIARNVQSGDIPFVCDASEVKLEMCTCKPNP